MMNIIELNGDAGGKRFDGIGVVNGGGATSVLLKDYPEKQRSQILDLMFKPKFGASISAMLVEVPGDSNSTQGAMSSHMHTREDLNYSRGYIWWTMCEAKKRNPDITLDANAWGCPGWVGNGNFWSQDMCDYYVKWIQGLKSVYGLDLDAIGCRNEKGVDYDFVKKFRTTLNANGLEKVKIHAFDNWGESKFDWVKDLETDIELQEAVDILGSHTMSEVPTPEYVKKLAKALNKPIWNTEEHIYKQGYDCEISLVQTFNENFIKSGVTKIVVWYDIAAIYPMEPYSEDPSAIVANSPWSGNYYIREALWAYAHYGQFSKVGWEYLNGACGELAKGGTYVTLKSPENDYSIIIETKNAKSSQRITFKVGSSLSKGNLCVWCSNANEQFVQKDSIRINDGCFTIDIEPNSIYSLSTTIGQQKGSFTEVPKSKSFPFPYFETFDQYVEPQKWGYLPRFTADISSIFEIVDRPDKLGKCLRQVIDAQPLNWAPDWKPYTIIGDENWCDYEVSVDVYLEKDDSAGVMGRVNDVGIGFGCTPKGYYILLTSDGTCTLCSVAGKDGLLELGDKENQARVLANSDLEEKGTRELATCFVKNFNALGWHNLKLQFVGNDICGFVDGVRVLSVINKLYSHGMAGLVTDDNKIRSTAYFTNLLINEVNGEIPKCISFGKEQSPIYI